MAELQVRTQRDALVLEWIEDGSLLSRAELRVQALGPPPLDYRICRLGAVFTPPERRRAGHARRLIARATAYIQSAAVDLAVLECRRELIPLYAASGWQPASPPAPEVDDCRPAGKEPYFIELVLPCSERAGAAYAALAEGARARLKDVGG